MHRLSPSKEGIGIKNTALTLMEIINAHMSLRLN